MPYAPRKPCRHPGCPNLVEAGRYCQEHKGNERQGQKQYDERRPKTAARGYDSKRWRKLRQMVLNNEPLCRTCQEQGLLVPATEVDHIDGDVRNMSWDNLQPLCKSCHSRKTARERT